MSGRSMVVSLIGRPNVGKSSLYNRIMRQGHKAITYDEPGVTRDRHYGIAKLEELAREKPTEIILVDTGGFYPSQVDESADDASKFFNIMKDHARLAIQESDLVLFVVDVREGILPFDHMIADVIRAEKKPFWVLVNKYDTEKRLGQEAEFYSLGVDEEQMLVVSAEHGLHLSELRTRLHQESLAFKVKRKKSDTLFLQKGVTPREKVVGRLALIGAPNAGKSTLCNLLVGAERALVSDIPGTTVDPIEGFFDLYFGKEARLLDEDQKFAYNDGLLMKHYEEFRKNNADVFKKLHESYLQEEIANGEIPDEEEMEFLYQDEEFEESAEDRLFEQAFDEVVEDDFENDFEDGLEDDSDELAVEASEEVTEDLAAQASEEEGSFWRSLHLVDTAGIRRQKSIDGFIESQSVYRSLRCITESDIVLYVIDATQGIGHQDRRLMDIALEKGKSIIVLLNKMDLLRSKFSNEQEKRKWIENLRVDLPWLNFVDIIPISAKHHKGIKQLKAAIKKTVLIRRVSISTGPLNRFVFELIERHPIVAKKSAGKKFKVKYASMVKSDPPTFLFFTNKSKGIPDNYRRYLQNGLRQAFKLDNTPVHLIFRTGADLNARMKKIGGDAQQD